MIFLRWGDPWNQVAKSSCASEGGFVSISFRLGRVAERSRWRRMPSGHIGARVRSLSSLGLAEAAGRDVISFEKAEDTSIDDAPMWVKTEDFPQVPRTMLDPSSVCVFVFVQRCVTVCALQLLPSLFGMREVSRGQVVRTPRWTHPKTWPTRMTQHSWIISETQKTLGQSINAVLYFINAEHVFQEFQRSVHATIFVLLLIV